MPLHFFFSFIGSINHRTPNALKISYFKRTGMRFKEMRILMRKQNQKTYSEILAGFRIFCA